MQVNLDLNIQVVDDSIVIQDNTLYGTGNIPNRGEVKVTYELFYLPYGEDKEAKTVPTFSFYSTTNLTIPSLDDGHYRVKVTSFNDGDERIETEEVFILHALPECVSDKKDAYKQCGGDPDATLEYLEVEAVSSMTQTLIDDEEYIKAQCLLQRGQNLCKDEDCKEC